MFKMIVYLVNTFLQQMGKLSSIMLYDMWFALCPVNIWIAVCHIWDGYRSCFVAILVWLHGPGTQVTDVMHFSKIFYYYVWITYLVKWTPRSKLHTWYICKHYYKALVIDIGFHCSRTHIFIFVLHTAHHENSHNSHTGYETLTSNTMY